MKKIIRRLVEINFTWTILEWFYRIANRFKFEKDIIALEKTQNELKLREGKFRERYKDLIVRGGIFAGMKYPDFVAHGSAVFPKLAGCYESELASIFEKILKNDYKTIVDIGCAEGYYAVGMALRKPNAEVFAYDINESALLDCGKMAALNGVQNRVHLRRHCSPETLINFDFSQRAFILCDCEGYEIDLFTTEVVMNLKNCDILIELHDLYNEKITPTIEKVFKNTHKIQLLYSENTFKRLASLGLNVDISDEDIKDFFSERNGIMQWALITSINYTQDN